MNTPTLTGVYTCTHHNDQQRAACPVCLVTTLTAERARLKRDYEYEHKCLHEVRERCELWKQRAERAEAELTKYLSACPASPTEEERKRCQQWWAISGRSP